MDGLPAYRRILAATDGSESAYRAGLHAIYLAQRTGAELHLVYVVDTHAAFRLGVYYGEAVRELRADGERALQRLVAAAREAGIEAVPELVEGAAGEAILQRAADVGADLIVVGSHGQSALQDVLLGSVSQHVIHHATGPVLVIRGVLSRG